MPGEHIQPWFGFQLAAFPFSSLALRASALASVEAQAKNLASRRAHCREGRRVWFPIGVGLLTK